MKAGIKKPSKPAAALDHSELKKLSLGPSSEESSSENDNQSSGDMDGGPTLPGKPGSVSAPKVRNKTIGTLALRPPKDLSITLFERLEKMYGTSIKKMLEVQYRYVYLFRLFHTFLGSDVIMKDERENL